MSLDPPTAGAPGPSPTPRRVATPRWLDLRLVVGVALVLGSVLVGARVVSAADRTYDLVAVPRDLAAGTRLSAADLHTVRVAVPDHGRGVYVQRPADAIGRTLRRDVAAGELLAVDAVRASPARTTISLGLPTGAAPRLAAGQRITVWLSTTACPSVVLLSGVSVQSVSRSATGAFASGDGGQDVVLDLTPATAARVVAALGVPGHTLRAGVLGGAVPTDAALPDLTRCLAVSGSGSGDGG